MVRNFAIFQCLFVWVQSLVKKKSRNVNDLNEQEGGEPSCQMENNNDTPKMSLGEGPQLDKIVTPETSQYSVETSDTESAEGNSGRLFSKREEKNLGEPKTSNSDAVACNLNIDLYKDLNPPFGFARVIGSGGFASVFKSTYHNIPVAIKYFHFDHQRPLNDQQQDSFQHELSIISQLDHKNIVKFYGACQKPGNRAIILGYVESNLYKMMENMRNINQENNTNKRFSISNIFKIIKATASALEYLHSKKIVHRDLHPWNILIAKDGCVKVADVGISKVLQHSTSEDSKRGGIFGYLAPEIFQGFVHYKSDIFSLGIIACELWSLEKNWEGVGKGLICQEILSGNRPNIPDDMPQNLRDLIKNCWQQDYKQRPTASDVVQKCESELAILASQNN